MDKNKKTLTYLIGLQASGKSTWSKEQVSKSKGKIKRLNKDDIRSLIDNGIYSKGNEKNVVKTERMLAELYLSQGYSVIVDNTGFNESHQNFYKKLASDNNANFVLNDSFLSVPLETCIARDLKRPNSVGEKVILKTYYDNMLDTSKHLSYNPDLPMVVICDLDGTLCSMDGKRSPYEWDKVGGDGINLGVSHILDSVKMMGYAKVFLFSGRDSVCRKETEEWLERNDIEYDLLAMRPRGSQEKDTVVKAAMLEKHVIGKYNVLFVMDDRPVVCRQHRDVYGLNVLQLGNPHIEF